MGLAHDQLASPTTFKIEPDNAQNSVAPISYARTSQPPSTAPKTSIIEPNNAQNSVAPISYARISKPPSAAPKTSIIEPNNAKTPWLLYPLRESYNSNLCAKNPCNGFNLFVHFCTATMKIHISDPCLENWDEMSFEEKGRHCAKCAKVVVDFSTMNDQQIGDYLTENTNACGRFMQSQLDRELEIHPPNEVKKPAWVGKVAAGVVLVNQLGAEPVMAQDTCTLDSNQIILGRSKVSLKEYPSFQKSLKFIIHSQDSMHAPQRAVFSTNSFQMAVDVDLGKEYAFHWPNLYFLKRFTVEFHYYNQETDSLTVQMNSHADALSSSPFVHFTWNNGWKYVFEAPVLPDGIGQSWVMGIPQKPYWSANDSVRWNSEVSFESTIEVESIISGFVTMGDVSIEEEDTATKMKISDLSENELDALSQHASRPKKTKEGNVWLRLMLMFSGLGLLFMGWWKRVKHRF